MQAVTKREERKDHLLLTPAEGNQTTERKKKKSCSHLDIAMNHVVVVAVAERLQDLPHVVAGWVDKMKEDVV